MSVSRNRGANSEIRKPVFSNDLFQKEHDLPNRLTPEIPERLVGRHESHAVEQGFGRDPAVKGIPVDGWKQARLVDHVPIQG